MAPPNELDNEFIKITDFEEFEEAHQVDKVIKTSSLYTSKTDFREKYSRFLSGSFTS